MGRRRKNNRKRKNLPEGGNEIGMEQPGSSRKHVKIGHPCKPSEEGEDVSTSVQEQKQVTHSNTKTEGVVVVTKAGDPFKLFPDVVMNEYLGKYLHDPKDKANLYWASPFAAKLLKPFMANWILNELYPIQTFRAMFSRSELLGFRLVCEEWRKAIGNYYERVYDMEPNYRHYTSVLATPVRLSSTDFRILQERFPSAMYFRPNLERFMLNHLTTVMTWYPNMNPFISKSAKLTFVDPRFESKGRSMTALLDRIGGGLLSLDFDTRKHESSSEILLAIKNCLDLVPHLVSLHCTFLNYYVLENNLFQDEQEGFPPLPNLKSLTLHFQNEPVYFPFTRYFEQLVSLDVSHLGNFMEWYDPEAHPPFPNLKKLSLQIRDLALLNKLNLLRSPLKELGIQYDTVGRKHNVCPFVYLNAAQNFAQTLITFKVEDDYSCKLPTKNMRSFGLRQLVKVNLPQLKCTSVTILDCGFGLVDHLLKLASSLEYLEVIVENCSDCKDNKSGGNVNKLQIHGYVGNLYGSNIWKLLPSLVEVQGWRVKLFRDGKRNADWTYTRAQYELGLLYRGESNGK